MSTTTSRRRLAMIATVGALGAAVLTAPAFSVASAASAIPTDLPREGCVTLPDPKGDYNTEAGFDIKGLVMRTTADSIIGYIQMYTLSSNGDGLLDQGAHFAWGFSLNNHKISAQADQSGPIAGLVRTVLAKDDTTGVIDGADKADFKAEARFDQKSNTAIISLNKAAVEKAAGAKLPDDAILRDLHAEAGPLFLIGLSQSDDTVDDAHAAPEAYEVGHNICFGPAPASVFIQGDRDVATGSIAKLEAKVLDADGTPRAGRQITFTIGSLVAKATTNSAGVASITARIPLSIGYYTQVTSFPGDATSNEIRHRSQFVVNYRQTHMKLSYSDRKEGRLFTATLLDADNVPVTGAPIDWTVKGTSKATIKTADNGQAQFLDRSSAREVKASYNGIKDNTSGSAAEFKY